MKLPFFSGLLLVLTAGACGDASSPEEGDDGLFTAKVNGVEWEAEPISIAANAGSVPGGLILVGTQNVDGRNQSLTITLGNIKGPGTYWLGVATDVIGGIGQVGEGTGVGGDANAWITDNTGTAGKLTLSRIDTRIVGTFEFVAIPGRNNELGESRTVTEGKFDLALKGTLPNVPEQLGSMLSAKLNGVFYNGWSANGAHPSVDGSGLLVSSTTKDHGVSLSLEGITGPGTYPLSRVAPHRTIGAGHRGGDATHCCWGVVDGDVGTIVVTSFSAKRAQGTFSGTIQPRANDPATEPLVVTEGIFDVGVP